MLELQSTHFQQSTSPDIQELHREYEIRKSYDEYINFLEHHEEGNWLTLLAKSGTKVLGFIIGSIESEEALLLNKIGKLEDWFVEPALRGQGIGTKLYNELEKWFKGKGCKQVRSETWQGNAVSMKAHEQAGFFISGIMFGKKL